MTSKKIFLVTLGFLVGISTGLFISKLEVQRQQRKDDLATELCIHRTGGAWFVIRAPFGTLYCVDATYLRTR